MTACGNGTAPPAKTEAVTIAAPSSSASAPEGAHTVRPPSDRVSYLHVSGRVDPEDVKRAIHSRDNDARARACWATAVKKNPNVEALVTTRIVIDREGNTQSSTPEGQGSDPDLAECVAAIYRTVTFPKPEAGFVFISSVLDFSLPELAH